MSARAPDFIIAGAPRSGTTWLCKLLQLHPSVRLAEPLTPEPKFFLRDDVYEKGFGFYENQWFADVPDDVVCGEKSTNYLESAVAAQRMHAHVPNVKLVFQLRDPVQRAYSNYRFSRMNGFEQESFARALELETLREETCPPQLRFARPYAYFSRGLYAELLAPYLRLFGRDQISILLFEDLLAPRSKAALAERLHRFLGISPRPGDAEALGVVNAAPDDGELDPDIARALADRYAAANRELAQRFALDLSGWAKP